MNGCWLTDESRANVVELTVEAGAESLLLVYRDCWRLVDVAMNLAVNSTQLLIRSELTELFELQSLVLLSWLDNYLLYLWRPTICLSRVILSLYLFNYFNAGSRRFVLQIDLHGWLLLVHRNTA